MSKLRFIHFLLLFCFIGSSHFSCTQEAVSSHDFAVKENSDKYVVVVLGSSTAEGAKASCKDSTWVGRLEKQIKNLNKGNQLYNLAKSGYTTYHLLPKTFPRDKNRPNSDTLRNVDKALLFNPTHVIINLPSNDAAFNFPNEEQIKNFRELMDFFIRKNIIVYLCSPQPRNFKSIEKRENQKKLDQSLKVLYKDVYIDFWNGFANKDLTILNAINSGDGIHLNDRGHRFLFERVKVFF